MERLERERLEGEEKKDTPRDRAATLAGANDSSKPDVPALDCSSQAAAATFDMEFKLDELLQSTSSMSEKERSKREIGKLR